MRQYVRFSELPIKCDFNFNGNKCKKVSTRTANFTGYDRTFYFSGKDLVTVGKHSRLDINYFKQD